MKTTASLRSDYCPPSSGTGVHLPLECMSIFTGIRTWGLGQVCDGTQTEAGIRAYAREIGADEDAAADAFREVTVMSRERFEKVGRMMHAIANQLASIGYQNIQQTRLIEENKRAEEALRASEQRARLMADLVMDSDQPVAVGIIDGRLDRFNPAFCELTGYTEEELLSLDWSTDLTPLEWASAERKLMAELERTGEPVRYEKEYIRKDGTRVPIEVFTHLRRGAAGEPDYYYAFITDITERKKAEAELRQAQKMESIGTLSGGIAHDFNNILGIIVGNTELALSDIPEWNPARPSLGEVLKASLRARDIVRHILTFSRQSDQEKKPVRLGLIIRETLKMLRATIPTTVEIREELATERDTVLADPVQMNQVLLNLCTNAAHAMRETGGRLCVSLGETFLDDSAHEQHPALDPGAWLVLTVSDTGHGISPEIMDRIFDPYFTTKGLGEGTGMGLAMVHGIVQEHGGAILAHSEPETRTVFEVYLPLMEGEEEQPEADLQPFPTGSERILLVDDEEALAMLGKRMLEQLRYEVTAKTSSLQALELFQQDPGRFDLVITDMTMPHMTGADLCLEMIRIRPDIPLILCTGFSEMISEEQAEKMGIRAFVTKPMSMRVLAETVRKVLES